MNKFEVKQTVYDPHPSLIGNGFDITIGDYREEAEEFTDWINKRLVSEDISLKTSPIYALILKAGRKIRDEACSVDQEMEIAEKCANDILNLISS